MLKPASIKLFSLCRHWRVRGNFSRCIFFSLLLWSKQTTHHDVANFALLWLSLRPICLLLNSNLYRFSDQYNEEFIRCFFEVREEVAEKVVSCRKIFMYQVEQVIVMRLLSLFSLRFVSALFDVWRGEGAKRGEKSELISVWFEIWSDRWGRPPCWVCQDVKCSPTFCRLSRLIDD